MTKETYGNMAIALSKVKVFSFFLARLESNTNLVMRVLTMDAIKCQTHVRPPFCLYVTSVLLSFVVLRGSTTLHAKVNRGC